jgi:DDE superfamily endonuclease
MRPEWARRAGSAIARRWRKGHRPPGRRDKRSEWACIFAAVEPATGADVALVLPEATTATMRPFLAEFAAALPEEVHAVLVLDGAGRHGARALTVPPNITLVPLPPHSPELDPVERVWLYLRERFLSLCGSFPTTAPSSTPVAPPGTASSPSLDGSARSATGPGSRTSVHRLAGITD